MGLLPINGFDLTACLELNLMCVCFFFVFLVLFYVFFVLFCLELTLMFLLLFFFSCFVCLFLSRICLASEKPDKELPGIVGARGDTV